MEISKTQIDKKFSGFQVDKKDPSILYCICDKNVYKVSMENQSNLKDTNFLPQSQTLKKFEKNDLKKILKDSQNDKDQEKFEKLQNFFSNPVNAIESFNFDEEKNFFFICNEKEIKKYDMETKKLLHTFKGHQRTIQQLVFAEDFSLMIR